MNGHGGKREGSGRHKGTHWPSTLAKAEAREKVRQFINERLGKFLEAMADNVLGIRHLMMSDPKTCDSPIFTGGEIEAKHNR